ncbi:FRG domain-containing protein [Methylophilus glucosoxydans]|uniref:FRG domain-containing protein n=1 Tax=Methylophilus glucosoxydans TaxID=752553 RepID=A0ABW3GHL0_9PROT
MQIVPATTLLEISKDFVDHRSRREQSWYWYSEEDHGGAIPFAVQSLYRGQNKRYLPMLPSIARGMISQNTGELWKYAISDQARIVLRLAQSWWFSRELNHHPITSHAANQKLKLDRIALAQHYGIPTGYLDLTDDFNVSAFFATCYETKSGWQPVTSGMGVIYRVNPLEISNYFPLGPQALPRPTEQCAWVTELPFCHAFDDWPNVRMMNFNHEKHIGEYFLEMFSGGEKLFPPDPLADVALEILACREIPGDLIEKALESFAKDPHGIRIGHLKTIRKELTKITTLNNYRRLLTDEKVSSLISDTEWRLKMLQPVTARARTIRRVPIQ